MLEKIEIVNLPKDMSIHLKTDELVLALGKDLTQYFEGEHKEYMLGKIDEMRIVLAKEYGVVVPTIKIKSSDKISTNAIQLIVNNIELNEYKIETNYSVATSVTKFLDEIKKATADIGIYGKPECWATNDADAKKLKEKGFCIVSMPDSLITFLTEHIRKNFNAMFGIKELNNILVYFKSENKDLFNSVIPNIFTEHQLFYILKNLLYEQVSIRNLKKIFEELFYWKNVKNNYTLDEVTEDLREYLSNYVTQEYIQKDGKINAIELQQGLEEKIAHLYNEKKLTNDDTKKLRNSIKEILKKCDKDSITKPVLICHTFRTLIRDLINEKEKIIPVLKHSEINDDSTLNKIGLISYSKIFDNSIKDADYLIYSKNEDIYVALKYEYRSASIPQIIAKFKGKRYSKILIDAVKCNIKLIENAKLSNAYIKCELGDYIPEETWKELINEIRSVFKAEKREDREKQTQPIQAIYPELCKNNKYIENGFNFLNHHFFDLAKKAFEKALKDDENNQLIHFGLLMSEFEAINFKSIFTSNVNIENNEHYKAIMKHGTEELKKKISHFAEIKKYSSLINNLGCVSEDFAINGFDLPENKLMEESLGSLRIVTKELSSLNNKLKAIYNEITKDMVSCKNFSIDKELQEFRIGKYPVTQYLYEKIMGKNPSKFKNPDNPVECVNWYDAMNFCKILNFALQAFLPKDYIFSLPTVKQWQYACLSNEEIARYNEIDWIKSEQENIHHNDIAWFKDNSNDTTHPVGQKKPNKSGIYDMFGNVWELCNEKVLSHPIEPKIKFMGELGELFNIVLGGSYSDEASELIYSPNYRTTNDYKAANIGFRLVLAKREN